MQSGEARGNPIVFGNTAEGERSRGRFSCDRQDEITQGVLVGGARKVDLDDPIAIGVLAARNDGAAVVEMSGERVRQRARRFLSDFQVSANRRVSG
jgi:hypothetical protein